jgi:hypothetical protein
MLRTSSGVPQGVLCVQEWAAAAYFGRDVLLVERPQEGVCECQPVVHDAHSDRHEPCAALAKLNSGAADCHTTSVGVRCGCVVGRSILHRLDAYLGAA